MSWEHVAWVASLSEPAKRYEVKRHPTTGALGCTCVAYRFAKGEKTCKHLLAYLGAEPVVAAVAAPEYAQAVVNGEAFTVIRAIRFRDQAGG